MKVFECRKCGFDWTDETVEECAKCQSPKFVVLDDEDLMSDCDDWHPDLDKNKPEL